MWSQLTKAQTATQTALVLNHNILLMLSSFEKEMNPESWFLPSLETSGPAHHCLILTSFLLHCVFDDKLFGKTQHVQCAHMLHGNF